MTYNQVLKRIQKIALGHKQVRTFKKGVLLSNFLADKAIKYSAVLLQNINGNISNSSHQATLNFRVFFLDLVHVSEDTNLNEDDVISDEISIALDIFAQINHPSYNDWKLSSVSPFQIVAESTADSAAGIYVDFTISIIYPQNVCQIPTTITDYDPTNPKDMNVYDKVYIASGNEGITLTTSGDNANIPEINGKKILMITREYSPIYPVSNLPQSTEYTWDNTNVGLGLATGPGERFLFLYRNYNS
jgi:hypothetical protein